MFDFQASIYKLKQWKFVSGKLGVRHITISWRVDKWKSDSTMQFHYICRQELFKFLEKKMSKEFVAS